MGTTDVLVVDDDELVRRLLIDLMRDEGYTARGASNGRDALEECERRLPELLLLDLAMPVLDGYEVLRELDQGDWPRFPIIVVSGNSDVSRSLSPRVAAVLRKPVDLVPLCREVKFALEREDGAAG